MKLSRFNIISEIRDSGEFFILNPLYGSADIIDRETHDRLIRGGLNRQEFIDRGYIVDHQEEEVAFRRAYLEFIDQRETDEVQLFFVPSYNCNFSCKYCYQGGYDSSGTVISKEVVDAFFSYVAEVFGGREKYITLFGGEPLLPNRRHRDMIGYIIGKAAEMGIEVSVVTNGYLVDEYIGILKDAKIREVQVTLDGTAEVHDKRRYLRNEEGTFTRITQGIDMLLESGIPVNLRMVVDRENIRNLPDMASFAINKGWTGKDIFTTQFGRNYELHECQEGRDRLFSRIGMYEEIYSLLKENPHILEFHRPGFSVSRALYDSGRLPGPLFDACPGTKTEWAFDYTGSIYACTATVGKKGEELGRFFPERVLYRDRVDEWEERDILSISECKSCNYSLLCGGGCAAVAGNRNGLKNSPDCRPVKELLELGIAAYFNKQPSHEKSP